MKCPKCGHEQADVFSQCQQCRYIFIPADRSAKGEGTQISLAPSPAPRGPSITALLGAIALAILLGTLLWWLWSPEGLPLPDNAYVNQKHHFAMASPPGWIALSQDNYHDMMQQLGNRLPKSLQDGLSSRRIEVGFIKILDEPNFSPSVNVVVMQTEMPELDEKALQEGSEALSEEYKKVLNSFKMESAELVTVDELTSARFNSRGELKLNVAPVAAQEPGPATFVDPSTAQWRTFDLRIIQTLVPGKRRAYIVTCTSEAQQSKEYKRAFDDVVDSFRVLERPSRFGPVVMGGIQGGLITALAYLLYFIVTALAALIRR